jgi:hypothetical protein
MPFNPVGIAVRPWALGVPVSPGFCLENPGGNRPRKG